MPWFENNDGNRLWYEDQGDGPVIVLVHGWCMSSAVWQRQIELLSMSFRVVAPDLRGHGRSQGRFAGYATSDFANDLAALFRHLNITGSLLAGWSMGGQIAMEVLPLLEGRVVGTALISSTPCFTANETFPHGLSRVEADGMALKVRRSISRALEGFRGLMFAAGELDERPLADEVGRILSEVAVPDADASLGSLQALAEADMRPLLVAVQLPTLVVWGDQDRICLPAASEYLHEHICSSQPELFTGCGHAPFLTRPERFAAVLADFFRRICGER